MTQAFYRKWRPQTWEAVIGQEHIISTLRNAIAADRMAHAYLFAGPRGTGKTTTARLLAKAANCLAEELSERPCNECAYCLAVNQGRFLDLIEIDAASNTSVEDVRDLREKINFSPNLGRYKIYIIDEVHMLSNAAFNALLKTLEEPPSHAIFVLATTEVHKIPATVLSRCQRHEFRRIPVPDIVANLETLAAGENLQVDPEAFTLIARQATGAMRDAISLLDQLASTSQHITLELAQTVLGTATSQAVIDITEAILTSDSAKGLDHIHQSLDSGSDPRQFARQIVDYLRNLLLVRMGNAQQIDATPEARQRMAQQAQAFASTPELLRIIQAFNHAASEARLSWQPALPLELALIESVETSPAEFTHPQEVTAPQMVSSPPKVRKPASKRAAESQKSAPPEDEPVPSEPEADSLPQNIAQNWDKVRGLVRQQNPQTQALLNSCKLLGIKNGILILGFNGEFAKTKMEQGQHIEILRQALQQVIGESLPVHCILSTGKSIPADVDQDGMVATALRDLGGEIVDIQ
ncbi:MAG TPA: DNA polymerase III subunit gamma/tau [Chloroflexi bacterium]|nr:DNA polymerase III subunit gamma/tau [Chloroflexota bacterium]